MAMVKHEEALEFLMKVGIVEGEKLLHNNKLVFLTKLIEAFHEHMPFQTVSLVATNEAERHVPTIEEVVASGLSLEGGVCFTINSFMCILLRAFGLDAHFLEASYSGYGDSRDHVIILVIHLRWTDDNYLVEVGCGYPCSKPVPLAELPVVWNDAGLEYCYRWDGHFLLRLHRQGDTKEPLPGEKPVMKDGWRQIFHFTLDPVDFDHFTPLMHHVYTGSSTCDFTSVIRAVRFPLTNTISNIGSLLPQEKKLSECTNIKISSKEEEDRIVLAMVNQSLLMGPMNEYEKTIVNEKDFATTIKHLFPTIPSVKVDIAVQKLLTHSSHSH